MFAVGARPTRVWSEFFETGMRSRRTAEALAVVQSGVPESPVPAASGGPKALRLESYNF